MVASEAGFGAISTLVAALPSNYAIRVRSRFHVSEFRCAVSACTYPFLTQQQIGLTRCLGLCRTIWARAFRRLPLPHSLLQFGGNGCIVAYQLLLRNWQHCTGAFKNRSLLFYAVFAQKMPINLGYLDGSEWPRMPGWRKGCPPKDSSQTTVTVRYCPASQNAPTGPPTSPRQARPLAPSGHQAASLPRHGGAEATMTADDFAFRLIAHKVQAVRWRGGLTVYDVPSWLWAALKPSQTDSNVTQVGRRLHVKTPSGPALAMGSLLRYNRKKDSDSYRPA